jgi:hypothetical protein
MNFEDLKGLTLTKITGLEKGEDVVNLYSECGRSFRMEHVQSCCESVSVEDICGDIYDILGEEITEAEEVSEDDDEANESGTWTFYKIGTRNGSVTIRWYGSSNGYYSESVSFDETTPKKLQSLYN